MGHRCFKRAREEESLSEIAVLVLQSFKLGLLLDAFAERLESKILADIKNQTDTKVTAIYFTDVAVQ